MQRNECAVITQVCKIFARISAASNRSNRFVNCADMVKSSKNRQGVDVLMQRQQVLVLSVWCNENFPSPKVSDKMYFVVKLTRPYDSSWECRMIFHRTGALLYIFQMPWFNGFFSAIMQVHDLGLCKM